MTQPIQIPGEDSAAPRRERPFDLGPAAFGASLAVAAGTALLGLVAGWVWAAVAPRAELLVIAPGQADLIHVETSAYIGADGTFVLVVLIAGLISGVLGYLLAVRKHGPLAMIGVLAGAVAAAYLARWAGEQSGFAAFQHQLATLPVGARMKDQLSLGAGSAMAFWPFAAGLAAGGLTAFAQRGARRGGAHAAP